MSFEDLHGLARSSGSRVHRGATENWIDVESRMGLQLPPDFKDAVDYFGSVLFNGFLYVHVPGSDTETDLASYTTFARGVLKEMAQIYDDQPYPIESLVPWASTINGDVCYWLTHGPPERWTVVVHDNGSEWFSYDGGCTSFVHGLLTRTVHCPFFPAATFARTAPTFEHLDRT